MSWSAIRLLLDKGDGYFARSDARRAGVDPRWLQRHVAAKELRVVHPNVLATHDAPVDLHHRFLAAVMQAGSDAALSHVSALAMYGLVREADHEVIHVSVPRDVRSVEGLCLHHAPRQAHNVIGGLPVVSVKNALVGCVGLLDERELRFPAMQAVKDSLITATELADLNGVPVRARKVMREMGEEALAGAESGGEANCYRLFTDSDLPTPELQVWIPTHRGPKRVDGYWAQYRLAYEVDGREYHTRVADFEQQPRRRNAIHGVQEVVLEFTVNQVMQEPLEVRNDAEGNLVARASELNLPLWRRRRRG